MVELRRDFRLATHAYERIHVGDPAILEDLQRHLSLEAGVACAIDDSLTASPDFFQEFIGAHAPMIRALLVVRRGLGKSPLLHEELPRDVLLVSREHREVVTQRMRVALRPVAGVPVKKLDDDTILIFGRTHESIRGFRFLEQDELLNDDAIW